MYVAKHFELPADEAGRLLASVPVCQFVVAHPEGPEATLLPYEFVPDAAGLGTLRMHVTRVNPVWKRTPLGESLAIVSGPDAYVTPEWFPGYPEKAEVPTWNYSTVHAYGDLVIHDDPEWCRDMVTRLSAAHGYDVAQVAERDMELMLRSVVGLELKLTRVLGKGKLHQNKSTELIGSVAAGLRERGHAADIAVAEAMEAISLPHADAREKLVGGIRAEHQLGLAQPRA